jgi:hypothetical protein
VCVILGVVWEGKLHAWEELSAGSAVPKTTIAVVDRCLALTLPLLLLLLHLFTPLSSTRLPFSFPIDFRASSSSSSSSSSISQCKAFRRRLEEFSGGVDK